MATTVRISETYDLKTTINKMGLIGIHTPADSLLRKLYPGLMKNHKFVRFVKCDVIGACASVLPADPLQVGVSSGEVAPEDMFNPILYKAVTNESFDNMVSIIYQGSRPGALGSLTTEELDSALDSFKVYYSLLAENGRFRKAMPQSGFSMRGLVPIAHTVVSSYGQLVKTGNNVVLGEDGETPVYVDNLPDVNVSGDGVVNTASTPNHQAVTFRGKPVKMPRIPLHYATEGSTTVETVNIPETFVGCIIVPPARLHEFYYRMRVTWTVRFEGVMSAVSILGNSGIQQLNEAYYKSYNFAKSETDMPVKEDSIDVDGVDINKIMES